MSDQETASTQSAESDSSGQQPAEPVAPAPARSRSGLVPAVLALFLALAAVGLAAWTWMQSQDVDSDLDPVHAALEAQQERGQRLERELATLTRDIETASERMGRLDQRSAALEADVAGLTGAISQADEKVSLVDARMDSLDEDLRGQMQALWQREGEQREIDRELERRMLLLEATSLLRLGQERIELGGDLDAARQAYRSAARLIQQADDPRLGQVRRLLAGEIDALEAVEEPDWVRLQSRLERIAATVADWPLVQVVAEESGPEESAPEADGWLASTRRALGRLVQVRQRDQLVVSDEQLETVREQVRLRLTAAELAISRRDTIELDHHLGAVTGLIERWFDRDHEAVAAAEQVFDQTRGSQADPRPTNLGQALHALLAHLEQS
jgi:uroporphyrin-III C-methyltransferase